MLLTVSGSKSGFFSITPTGASFRHRLLLRPDDGAVADREIPGRRAAAIGQSKRPCRCGLAIHRINVLLALACGHYDRMDAEADLACRVGSFDHDQINPPVAALHAL